MRIIRVLIVFILIAVYLIAGIARSQNLYINIYKPVHEYIDASSGRTYNISFPYLVDVTVYNGTYAELNGSILNNYNLTIGLITNNYTHYSNNISINGGILLLVNNSYNASFISKDMSIRDVTIRILYNGYNLSLIRPYSAEIYSNKSRKYIDISQLRPLEFKYVYGNSTNDSYIKIEESSTTPIILLVNNSVKVRSGLSLSSIIPSREHIDLLFIAVSIVVAFTFALIIYIIILYRKH
ncbi:MAG: hypothetical protein ARM1_0514 [Candidatus Micrarchaeota archaeon]|nr:MAG: hypothetical protein ARM1_0514 [Candidatus Micrarchaeota archaeon]